MSSCKNFKLVPAILARIAVTRCALPANSRPVNFNRAAASDSRECFCECCNVSSGRKEAWLSARAPRGSTFRVDTLFQPAAASPSRAPARPQPFHKALWPSVYPSHLPWRRSQGLAPLARVLWFLYTA